MSSLRKQLHFSIIIPNYNGKYLLSKNLPSIVNAFNNKSNNIREVIIVDDASTDNSVKYIKELFPTIKVIKHRENRGFAPTVNTGARTARSELLVLLNSDVKPEKDFLYGVAKLFKDKNLFAVSLHEKGYGWAKGVYEKGFINHKPGREDGFLHESFWASGGSGVFRRSYWMKLKGFDESLFKFYWEDVDICYRAQKRGWKILWDPKAMVIHNHESSTGKRFTRQRLSIMQEVNQLIFIWKNLTSPILFRKHLMGLLTRVSKHPGYWRIIFLSLLKFRKIIRKRKLEKRLSIISDEAIFAKF